MFFGLGGILIQNLGDVFSLILERLLGRNDSDQVMTDAGNVAVAFTSLFALAVTIIPLARLRPSGRMIWIGMIIIFASALWGIGQGLWSQDSFDRDAFRTTMFFWGIGAVLFGLPAVFSKEAKSFEVIGLAVVAAIIAAIFAGLAQLVFRLILDFRSVSPLVIAPMGLAPAAAVWGLIVSRLHWSTGFKTVLFVTLLSLPFFYGAYVNFPDKAGLGGIFANPVLAGLACVALALAPALAAAVAGRGRPFLALHCFVPIGAAIAAAIAVVVAPQTPELAGVNGKIQFVAAHVVGSVTMAIIAVWLSDYGARVLNRLEAVWQSFLEGRT